MLLIWVEEAISDLEQIEIYIEQDNPDAAARVKKRLVSGLARLQRFPHMGRVGRLPETREFVFSDLPYIGIYRVDSNNDLIQVLRIIHTSQHYPQDNVKS